MMTSLFSSFDPCSSMPLTTNWLSSLIILMMVFSSYWICPNRYLVIFNKINMNMHSEFKNLLGPQTFGVTLMFTSILLFIMFNNFMGLYPYIFTSSSHMVVTMSLSLPLWVSFMLYGWINHTNHMFSHLVPQSTPGILMPFMVVIETVSNVIRPGTLAVRLAANMIAGHLLMTLLGNQTASVGVNLIGILLGVQIILLTLESAVAVIQSYVFAILVTLYSSEIESH